MSIFDKERRHRSLKPLVEFKCTGCGDCCRHWRITVERSAYEFVAQKLAEGNHPGRIPDAEAAFDVLSTPNDVNYAQLKHQEDGSCVFLEPDNLCYWHKHFGAESKGWVCQAFPRASHLTPGSVVVAGSLACRPLIDHVMDHHAGPLTLIDVEDDQYALKSRQFPEWLLVDDKPMLLESGRHIDVDGVDIVVDAVLEFFASTQVPLGVRLMMGRLFLKELSTLSAGQRSLSADAAKSAFEALERDATALYIEAVNHQIEAPGLLAQTTRVLTRRLATVGVPSAFVPVLREIIDNLQLESPIELITAHIWRLHQERFVPQLPALTGALEAYACHRWVRGQAMSQAGFVPAYTQLLVAMTLVWSVALGKAYAADTLVTRQRLAEAIYDVEHIFFHTAPFHTFLGPDFDLSAIHKPSFAAILTDVFNPSQQATLTQRDELSPA